MGEPDAAGDLSAGRVTVHILPASANLLGLCFVILSFLRMSKFSEGTVMDESTVIATALFLGSSIFSYASLRSEKRSRFYERVADFIFLAGLFFLAVVSVIIFWEIVP
ncbi:MAG: hypothetical protein WC291_00700 [Thermodesulfovibrionales bacterium]